MRALGVQAGDEVIVPANTYIATAAAVVHAGGAPVFVDVLEHTGNIDPAAVAAAVGPRTVGVVGVHLYGQPFDVDAVTAVCEVHGLWLMEDAAQAHLARYRGRAVGGLARCAAVSFYPSKNLGAPCDGGAVVTQDPTIARAIRRLRDHGQETKSVHLEAGHTARLGSLAAAVLTLKLELLGEWNEQRAAAATAYLGRLRGVAGLGLPHVEPWATPVWHLFVVQTEVREARDRIRSRLAAAGVQTGIHYPTPCHLQPAFQHLGHGPGDFPVSEARAAHSLSLPMYAGIQQAAVDYVCDSLVAALQEVRG